MSEKLNQEQELNQAKEMFQDGYAQSVATVEEACTIAREYRKKTAWQKVYVNKIRIVPITREQADNDKVFADALKNTQLAISLNDGIFPLRSTAIKSCLDRSKISGSIISKLKADDLATILNICFSTASSRDEGLLYFSQGKVSAFFGKLEVDYSVIPQDTILESAKEFFKTNYPNALFQGSIISHEFLSASWDLSAYQRHFLSNFPELDEYVPMIDILTSDVGLFSVTLLPYFEVQGKRIVLNQSIKIKHKGKNSLADVEEGYNEISALFEQSAETLKRLSNTHIQYATTAMKRMMKAAGISKISGLKAVESYELFYGNESTTALEIYLYMCEVPFFENADTKRSLRTQEALIRILGMSWEKHDLPGGFDWC